MNDRSSVFVLLWFVNQQSISARVFISGPCLGRVSYPCTRSKRLKTVQQPVVVENATARTSDQEEDAKEEEDAKPHNASRLSGYTRDCVP